MNVAKRKTKPWLKRVLIAGFILVLALAGIYGYIATEKFADTKDRESDFTVNAISFIREFHENHKTANGKYADKIITVNGIVSEIEAADTTFNIKFIDDSSGSYIIFAFQSQHANEARSVKKGDSISIKGSCSGGIYSDILEATSVSFKRSTLINP